MRVLRHPFLVVGRKGPVEDIHGGGEVVVFRDIGKEVEKSCCPAARLAALPAALRLGLRLALREGDCALICGDGLPVVDHFAPRENGSVPVRVAEFGMVRGWSAFAAVNWAGVVSGTVMTAIRLPAKGAGCELALDELIDREVEKKRAEVAAGASVSVASGRALYGTL